MNFNQQSISNDNEVQRPYEIPRQTNGEPSKRTVDTPSRSRGFVDHSTMIRRTQRLSRFCRFLVTVGFLGGTLGAACKKQPAGVSESTATKKPRPTAATSPSSSETDLYDREGRLLPSDTKLLGIQLPRGAQRDDTAPSMYVFHTRVPIEKVLSYFGVRLITGDVQQIGNGAIYREAVPKSASKGAARLEVAILPSSRYGTRIELRELPSKERIEVLAGERNPQKKVSEALRRME